MRDINTYQLLIDDGLYGPLHKLEWHDQFTKAPTKRIVRLERLAEDIVMQMANDGVKSSGIELLSNFEQRFLGALDPKREDVVGYKSIAAYRSGLAISTNALENSNLVEVADALDGALASAYSKLQSFTPSKPEPFVPLGPRIRIGDKPTIDYLVLHGCQIALKHDLPIQFHTGHGDQDMNLLLSNPAHLQPLLQDSRFEDLKLVLLHTSYPYTKEAGWLASSFNNVYVDIGELQPMVSRHALTTAIKELLHLAPLNRIMYSSDAHVYPETYYFGALYYREALAKVLCETVEDGDLTEDEAIEAARMIGYKNAVWAYKLDTVVEDPSAADV